MFILHFLYRTGSFDHLFCSDTYQKIYSIVLVIAILLSDPGSLVGQSLTNKRAQYSISAAAGMACDLFSRGYEEQQDIYSMSFYRKNRIGTAFNLEIKRTTAKGFCFSAIYSRQIFSREIFYDAVINNTLFSIDHSIRQLNNMYRLTAGKQITSKSHSLNISSGIYYLRPVQEEISLTTYPVMAFIVEDRRYRNRRLEELGLSAETAYEFQIRQGMYGGVRTQIFYTITSGNAEAFVVMACFGISL